MDAIAVKVGPGDQNHGIWITCRGDEEYNLTHPWATLNGLLTGTPFITVSGTTVVQCPKTGLKALIEYKEEPFFGSARYEIQGKVFKYDYEAEKHMNQRAKRDLNKLSAVPNDDQLVCSLSGKWNDAIYIEYPNQSEKHLLFNLMASEPATKVVRPIEEQTEMESRK